MSDPKFEAGYAQMAIHHRGPRMQVKQRHKAMVYDDFHNALRILLNIDRDEFAVALERSVSDAEWTQFRDGPHMWFIRAPDQDSARVFEIVKERNLRK